MSDEPRVSSIGEQLPDGDGVSESQMEAPASAEYVEAFIRELNDSGIEYAVLHSAESIPDSVTSDIDLVVEPGSQSVLTAMLRRFSEDRGGLLCQVIRHEATARYHVLALPDLVGGPSYLKVDASTDYRRNGRVLFKAGNLLRDTRWVGDVRAVSSGHEFAAYLAKCVLKQRVTAPHLVKLRRLYSLSEAECRLACQAYLNDRGLATVHHAMCSQDSDRSALTLLRLRSVILRGAFLRHPVNALMMPASNVLRVAERMIHRTGFQLAVLGPDGVGKTTALTRLAKTLGPAFRRTQQLHLRPNLLPGRGSGEPEMAARPYAERVYPAPASLAKLAYLALDYLLGYVWVVWPKLVASTLVLCDRYYADLVADPRRYRYGGPKWVASVFGRIVPGPDLYVVLMGSTAIIQSRKREVSRRETDAQSSGYCDLARTWRRVVVVNADQPPRSVASDIAWECLRAMAVRRVNGPT